MSAVIKVPQLFAVNRELRKIAAAQNLPASKLLDGCRAALREIGQGRDVGVALLAGTKAMRS